MRINLTPAVKQILIACIVLYIGTFLFKAKGLADLEFMLAAHYPNSGFFKPWQIITHMFMHDSNNIGHLIFNMFGLVSIGVILEDFMGTKKFVQLYFFSGLGALAVHILVQIIKLHYDFGLWLPSPADLGLTIDGSTIYSNGSIIKSQEELQNAGSIIASSVEGASGALYGVVVAYAFLFPNRTLMIMFIPYPIKAKYLIPGFLVVDIVMGITNSKDDTVAHFAHIGGAIFGFLLVWYWRKFDRKNFF
ncbi:MAG: rhomboid family intramembrane serine protease [bacterium]|nr:rhomboid family intramembrane serine protease [bacterium]